MCKEDLQETTKCMQTMFCETGAGTHEFLASVAYNYGPIACLQFVTSNVKLQNNINNPLVNIK